MFTFCSFINPSISYLVSIFSSNFRLSSSISNSFSDNVLLISSSFLVFSSSSFSNFSLFSFSPSFLLSFISISCVDFSIFCLISSISCLNLSLFSSLFWILDLVTLISEFNISISFWLVKPRFCVFSIFSVSSSIVLFKSSLIIFIFSSFDSSKLQFSCIIEISWFAFSKSTLYFSILYTNKPTSISLSSAFKSTYFLAFSLWAFKGSRFPSISVKISFILRTFSLVRSNFFSDSSFLVLNLTIPAASSKTFLLSSDLLLKISSILPCPMIEYPSFPIPVSINSSSTSLSLHWTLFIK